MYATFEGQRVVTYAGVPNDDSLDVEIKNGALFNSTLASLQPGDIFVIPNSTFYTMGGIIATGLTNVTISFEGTLVFSTSMKSWPRSTPGSKGQVLECLNFVNARNLRLLGTVPGGSVIDGNGATWWGFPGIGYLLIGASRARRMCPGVCAHGMLRVPWVQWRLGTRDPSPTTALVYISLRRREPAATVEGNVIHRRAGGRSVPEELALLDVLGAECGRPGDPQLSRQRKA